MLPDECDGCARNIRERCIAMTNPDEAWEDGECFAYEEDPAEVERQLMEAAEKGTTKERAQLEAYREEYSERVA